MCVKPLPLLNPDHIPEQRLLSLQQICIAVSTKDILLHRRSDQRRKTPDILLGRREHGIAFRL